MRGLLILSTFLVVYDGSADALAPVYIESAFPVATRAAEAARLRDALVRERNRAQGVNRRLDAAFGALPTGALERVRAEKRRFLRERAFAFAETALTRGDATGLGFAEQSVADAATINGMLEEELADWAVAPRPANDPIALNVRDYGAAGDGVVDDAPAFARACAAVRALGGHPSILRVPAGTYRFASVQHARQRYVCTPRGLYDDNPWTLKAFGLFDNLANCLIEGDGPTNTFLRAGFHGQQVALVNCRNTRFRGFELSMERVPFLEGEIESWDADAQACVVRLDAGTLRPDEPSWTPTDDERTFGYESFGAEYGKDGLLMRDAAVLRWDRKTFVDLGDGRWRIPFDGCVYPSHVRNVKPGGKLVLPNRTNAYGAFVMKFCTGCTAEDVWVRTSRSSAFWSLRSDRATFFRCRAFPLPGRSLSSNADGCFVDPGAFVWQCRFENVCDDGLNAKSYASWTLPGHAPVEVARADLGANRGGEVATFFDPCTAQYLANRTFAHDDAPVWTASNGWRRVSRFTRAVDGLCLGDSWIFETRQRGIGTYVGACAFRNVRLAGCVIQTPCTLVEDVTFENVQDTGVRLGSLGDFREGPPPYNALVRNCRIDGCRTGVAAWLRMCDRAKTKWFDVACAPIRGLDLVGVSVVHATRAAYDFSNAGDVRLVDCTVNGRAVDVADVKTARVENLKIENTKE